MAFKGTAYKLAWYLLCLLVAAIVAVYGFVKGYYPLLIVAIPAIAGFIYATFRLFSQNIRKLTFLFNAIANGDYSFQFTEYNAPASDNLLNQSLNRIRDLLLAEKNNIARMEAYYELIINSVNTGILVVNENGSIFQSNQEAHRLLRLSILTHIRQLSRIDESLPAIFQSLQTTERRQIDFPTELGTQSLLLQASEIAVKGKMLKIVAINEIGSELDEREVESWIKLTRVLTHEIMNAITPITSLSDTLLDLPEHSTDKLKQGLQTIKTTGNGLLAFVDSYRKFTRIPDPSIRLFYLKPLLERLLLLNQTASAVSLEVKPDDLILHADENLIFQVLANLVNNALDAVRYVAQPSVRISAFVNTDDQVVIEVADNGNGIPEEIRPHIFVPFFTTKENGSGIGLSISRQIMRLHNGTLSFAGAPGETRFVLTFR